MTGIEKYSPNSRKLLVEENHKKYLLDKVRLKYLPQPEAVSLVNGYQSCEDFLDTLQLLPATTIIRGTRYSLEIGGVQKFQVRFGVK